MLIDHVPERLLFLDFDGVLHPTHCIEESYFSNLHKLLAIIGQHQDQLRIVISSSWRFHYTWDELLAFFPQQTHRQIVGATGPTIPGTYGRLNEILAYLDDYRGWADWRALDDDAEGFPDDCPQLIRCDGMKGLGPNEMDQLKSWLGQPIV